MKHLIKKLPLVPAIHEVYRGIRVLSAVRRNPQLGRLLERGFEFPRLSDREHIKLIVGWYERAVAHNGDGGVPDLFAILGKALDTDPAAFTPETKAEDIPEWESKVFGPLVPDPTWAVSVILDAFVLAATYLTILRVGSLVRCGSFLT